jgi:ankyrin repeat protein
MPDAISEQIKEAFRQNDEGQIWELLNSLNPQNNREELKLFLHYAARWCYPEMVRKLVENYGIGADAPVDTSESSVKCQDTPLIHVCGVKKGEENNKFEIAKYLLDRGANPDANPGMSPLHHAASNNFQTLVRLLYDYKANIDQYDGRGVTPLGRAVKYPVLVKYMLQKLRSKVNEGRLTPLDCLYDQNRPDDEIPRVKSAVILLSYGAKINISERPNVYSNTFETGKLQLVKLLLKRNIDLNQLRDPEILNNSAVLNLLIVNGLDVNTKNDSKNTLLHIACMQDKNRVFRPLIKAGADLEAKNNRDETPYETAKNSNSRGVLRLFEELPLEKDIGDAIILDEMVDRTLETMPGPVRQPENIELDLELL